MAGENRIRREPAQREELLKIPLNKPAPLKREKCRKTMSRIVFAVWQYASLPKGLNSYNNAEHDIEINWLYDEDNDSSMEAGEDFIEDFEDLTINLVSK